MNKTLQTIKSHKRVEDVSVENGGDFIMIKLAKGWSRYGTGCRDGYYKSFDLEDEGVTLTSALKWIRNGPFECADPNCKRCH